MSVWVRDTGVGMTPATQARIFDPFFTTKPTGRGLGLAAAQGIVRGHGGAITLESEPNGGTTFSILLPHTPLDEGSPLLTPRSHSRSDGMRVLVVDDEVGVRKVVSSMLERAGYSVLTASDGQEAVDVFRRQADSIDCVLLDLSMPKLDGEEAFREMQQIRADVPVILSSGFTDQEIVDRFRGGGLAGVIHKPARMHVLLEKVASVMRERRNVKPSDSPETSATSGH